MVIYCLPVYGLYNNNESIDLFQKNYNGDTAFMYACSRNCTIIAEWLLNRSKEKKRMDLRRERKKRTKKEGKTVTRFFLNYYSTHLL